MAIWLHSFLSGKGKVSQEKRNSGARKDATPSSGKLCRGLILQNIVLPKDEFVKAAFPPQFSRSECEVVLPIPVFSC